MFHHHPLAQALPARLGLVMSAGLLLESFFGWDANTPWPSAADALRSQGAVESQLISAVEVLAGNAGDQEKALELVQQSERAMEVEVVETVGDCAYRLWLLGMLLFPLLRQAQQAPVMIWADSQMAHVWNSSAVQEGTGPEKTNLRPNQSI
jgi:hypothetical protein